MSAADTAHVDEYVAEIEWMIRKAPLHFWYQGQAIAYKQAVLEDEERRKDLYQRLLFSLEGESDPWHEPEKAQEMGVSVCERQGTAKLFPKIVRTAVLGPVGVY